MKQPNLVNHTLIFTIGLCLFIWLVDVFYWSSDRQLIEPITLHEKALTQSSMRQLKTLRALNPIKLADSIQLPPVPAKTILTAPPSSSEQSKSNSPTLALKMSGAAALKAEEADLAKVAIGFAEYSVKKRVNAVDEFSENGNASPSSDELQEVINTMLEMEVKDIRFLLPRIQRDKESFLGHMYRCENMRFGAISNSQPYKLSVLSKPAGTYVKPSQLLRIAHEYLSKYERNLMRIYTRQSQAVRVFSAELDLRLAEKIAIELKGNILHQFSARYFIRDSKVGLKEIMLNRKQLSDQWMLSLNRCL
ncbi:MAG: hypothetical protein ACI97K_000464 [Glaciecola sp.]|jgi:hypothetical protein